MAPEELTEALQDAREIEITVTGRRSGRESTRPVWFVHEGDSLYLVPVSGTESSWYRNLLANSTIRVRAGETGLTADAIPIEDTDRVAEVVDRFGAKYGADKMESLYSRLDAAVEVPISSG
jgi:deazaflavin-dependent oxidoreductase (nitroreductase family)